MMKKLGLFLGFIFGFGIILLCFMIYNDKNYVKMMKKDIINNTEITKIEYVNKYDNYYIILGKDNLYLIDEEYNIVLEVERFLIHDNDNNYDIIYRNNHFMYLNEINKEGSIVYEYYDIYTYEMIESIMVGGSNG